VGNERGYGYEFWVISYKLWVMGYGLWVMGYGLWVMVLGYELVQSRDSHTTLAMTCGLWQSISETDV
jgi:hypothetical protein